ncbi:hypothetical protein EUX98_g181 [Antrodiella citrinella]|uniref:Uncharacterized protein n=1 Tax=Antrodiella citrinella TaxID=2447956 RepID=A0A4S4N7U0_9APHY|nr:hypothetical protein EUX98_g181 [Antrodiella citrinella]
MINNRKGRALHLRFIISTMAAACFLDIRYLLGLHPSSDNLSAHISSLVTQISSNVPVQPEIKCYPDAVYYNYHPIGLSLQFKPVNGYKPKTGMRQDELQPENLVLDGVDMYNMPSGRPQPGTSLAKNKSPYASYPTNPIHLSLAAIPEKSRPQSLSVTPATIGKDFVECFGEPDRKGGGAGPSSGSIGIWCEWSKDGVMVEFGGDEARGPQAWERGKDATWKVITVFRT